MSFIPYADLIKSVTVPFCSINIVFPLPARKLLRVLPLPGENWGTLVEEWCCHPDPFANKPLHPQENDCFTGDTFFLVNLRSDLQQPRPEVAPVEMCCLSSENHLMVKYLFRINVHFEVGLEIGFAYPIQGM